MGAAQFVREACEPPMASSEVIEQRLFTGCNAMVSAYPLSGLPSSLAKFDRQGC